MIKTEQYLYIVFPQMLGVWCANLWAEQSHGTRERKVPRQDDEGE